MKVILILSIIIGCLNAGEYQRCSGCHGLKGEKSALSKSKYLNVLSAEEFRNALKGYRNETFGGKMKNLMISQAKRINDIQTEAIIEELGLK